MNGGDKEQSGLQQAYRAARAAQTVVRIARAAAVTGSEGAAVEAAKAALPQILKVLLCVAAVLMILPMAVFISLPHVFFGCFHSANPPVVLATDQAMELGNVCMSLDEFQNTVIDSIITAIVNSYEQSGIHIDEIRIENHFEEDDLLWFISINSVANKQNLDEISVDRIKELCADKLDYRWSLLTGEKTILKLEYLCAILCYK
ncbi:MAG: hypothetical protein IJT94_03715 [Oscillibacter sp.]|nr:hypothetical protein [Oscillibacter sp.]